MLLSHLFLLHLPFKQALPATVDKCSLGKSFLNRDLGSCQHFSDTREECRCEEDFEVCKFSLSEVKWWVMGDGEVGSENTEYGVRGGYEGEFRGGGGKRENREKGEEGEEARTVRELSEIGVRPVKEEGGEGATEAGRREIGIKEVEVGGREGEVKEEGGGGAEEAGTREIGVRGIKEEEKGGGGEEEVKEEEG